MKLDVSGCIRPAARTAAAALAALLLSGCISLPATPDALRASAAGTQVFVADAGLADAYRIVAANVARCEDIAMAADRLAMAGSFTVSASKVIEGRFDDARGAASVSVHFSNMAATGYLQLIDLERVGDGQTRIIQHRLNDAAKWERAGEALRGWFEGDRACAGDA